MMVYKLPESEKILAFADITLYISRAICSTPLFCLHEAPFAAEVIKPSQQGSRPFWFFEIASHIRKAGCWLYELFYQQERVNHGNGNCEVV